MVDEFQRVPDLLAAIKSEFNRDRRPGRFVLAGSARHEAVPEFADFLTGLVHLRERLGDRFVASLLLNAGSQAQRVGIVFRSPRWTSSGTSSRLSDPACQ